MWTVPITELLRRVLNLFSRDTYVVDQILPRVIQNLFRTSAVCVFILIVIGSSFPPFILSVIRVWCCPSLSSCLSSVLFPSFGMVLSPCHEILPGDVPRAQATRRCLAFADFRVVFRVFGRCIDVCIPVILQHGAQRDWSSSS